MARYTVCKVADLEEGKIVPATAGKARIVLSRLANGEIRAYTGRCPHQGAPLEYGCVTSLVAGDHLNEITVDASCNVLRCPWHGFEFSLATGQAVVQNTLGKYLRLRRYEVEIDGDDVVVVT